MFIQKGTLNQVRLLQTKKAKLSTIKSNEGVISSITNCSFFATDYVVGRNQGDEISGTYSERDDYKFYDVVVFNDGTYKAGKFANWEYTENVVAGFSTCAFLVQDGKNCELYSEGITNAKGITNQKTSHTAFVILADKTCLQVVGENMTGFEMRNELEKDYDIELFALLDGGGSSEMIVNGVIVNTLKDGSERPMFNGLAFIEKEQDPKLRYPCLEGWDSQGYKSNHKGLDFGWCKAKGNGNTDIQACADGVVEFEGFYEQKFSDGKTYKPIGVILRHTQFSKEYDYISIYWHLKNTCINKGDKVKEGQKLGLKGNTGFSGGIHLHFQLLKIAKGAPVPDQHNPAKVDNWAKVSINPTNLLRVHDDQYFQFTGNFNLKKASEDVGEKYEQMKYAYEQVLKANQELKEEYNELGKQYESVVEQLTTVNNKLKQIKEVLE